MAHPFGGSPTLREYIGWCNQQGCTTNSGFSNGDGHVCTLHILAAKSGKHVVVSGIDMTERLSPTMVAYYDRRLGLDSPFGKIGDGSYKPDDC